MSSKPARQAISPEVRREVVAQVALLDALTFSSTVTQAEAQALRDAVSTALETLFGAVTS